ncbi:MAG: VWA domain-containing protein [Deltaproteobacteria bacterium]|jgi:Ca-activated chloride channel family protein|nr:VWA domain-containing protein [Deltaproteobacteria bacterium]
MRFPFIAFLSVLSSLLVLCLFSQAMAQKILPTDPKVDVSSPLKAVSVELFVDIDGQKAHARLKHKVKNSSSSPQELDFMMPLPLEGAVTDLILVANGQEMVGNIYSKEEAFGIYQEIVQRRRDPALLEYAGRGLYRARVFPVPAGETITLELSMDYLLPKESGKVTFHYPLSNPLTKGHTLDSQEVLVNLKGESIGGIYSPTEDAVIAANSGGATVSLKKSQSAAISDFKLYFQQDAGPLGGLILSHKPSDEDGFFLFLAEPNAQQKTKIIPKTVIFILDCSGSMAGVKFEQAQGALRFVLERLNQEDNFNLVTFESTVDTFKPENFPMNPENRNQALDYIDNLRPGGATNIEGALKWAFKLVNSGQPTYVIFLTDGEATEGETGEMALYKIFESLNTDKDAKFFSFGVGYDVNSRLLERLSSQAHGFCTFIGEQENLEEKVSLFFSKMSTPVLTSPELTISTKTNRLIPAKLPDIFMGGQTLVVGRYPKGGEVTFKLSGKDAEDDVVFSYPAQLTSQPNDGGEFVAQLWAQRRIGELIEQIDLGGQNSELAEELLNLSKRYGIMTPYTSFLALENQSLTDVELQQNKTRQNLGALSEVTGSWANEQRSEKEAYKSSAMAAPAPAADAIQSDLHRFGGEESDYAIENINPPVNLAGRAFFNKQGQWLEGSLTEESIKNATVVEKFSEDYFKLAGRLNSSQMVWLTQSEPIIFNFEGVDYLVQNPKDS